MINTIDSYRGGQSIAPIILSHSLGFTQIRFFFNSSLQCWTVVYTTMCNSCIGIIGLSCTNTRFAPLSCKPRPWGPALPSLRQVPEFPSLGDALRQHLLALLATSPILKGDRKLLRRSLMKHWYNREGKCVLWSESCLKLILEIRFGVVENGDLNNKTATVPECLHKPFYLVCCDYCHGVEANSATTRVN